MTYQMTDQYGRTVYRVTLHRPGQRSYVGVLANNAGAAQRAASRQGWTTGDVSAEPERPIDITA